MERKQSVASIDNLDFAQLDIQGAKDVELTINLAINERDKCGTYQEANRLRRLLLMLRQEAA